MNKKLLNSNKKKALHIIDNYLISNNLSKFKVPIRKLIEIDELKNDNNYTETLEALNMIKSGNTTMYVGKYISRLCRSIGEFNIKLAYSYLSLLVDGKYPVSEDVLDTLNNLLYESNIIINNTNKEVLSYIEEKIELSKTIGASYIELEENNLNIINLLKYNKHITLDALKDNIYAVRYLSNGKTKYFTDFAQISNEAMNLYRTGKYAEFIEKEKVLLESKRVLDKTYRYMAFAYYKLGKYKEALELATILNSTETCYGKYYGFIEELRTKLKTPKELYKEILEYFNDGYDMEETRGYLKFSYNDETLFYLNYVEDLYKLSLNKKADKLLRLVEKRKKTKEVLKLYKRILERRKFYKNEECNEEIKELILRIQ